jgi:hypothetical protein
MPGFEDKVAPTAQASIIYGIYNQVVVNAAINLLSTG